MALLAHGAVVRVWSRSPAQDCPAEPQLLGTQGRSKALGAAGSGRSSAGEAAQGSKAWPGMQYPTVCNALIQQHGESRKSYFSHFRGKVWICSCSGSHPMTHLTPNCMFRCSNSHFSQEGTGCHDVGWHQQQGQMPP